ncbi:hypothetical protein ABPG73_014350 [Tetrahymena malaccensis]
MSILIDDDNNMTESKQSGAQDQDIQIINEHKTIKKIKLISDITKEYSKMNPSSVQLNQKINEQNEQKRNSFQINDVPQNIQFLNDGNRKDKLSEEQEDFMKFDEDVQSKKTLVKEEIVVEEELESQDNRNKKKVFYEFNQPISPDQEELPVHENRLAILETIKNNSVIVISGNTGCGKSTQIPKFIACDDTSTKIIVTQPRRVAAIALAERVSQELKSNLGQRVGYQIGQDSNFNRNTQILYVTIGIFLQKLIKDPDSFLREYTHIILDEVHERGIESDFGLIALKTFLSQHKNRNTIKLIVMSATLNKDIFLNYFSITELNNLEKEIKDDQDCQEYYFDSSKFSEKLKISKQNDDFSNWGQHKTHQTWNDQEEHEETYEKMQKMICRFNCKYESNQKNYVEIQVVQKYTIQTIWLEDLNDTQKLCNKNYFNARKPELNEDLYKIVAKEIKRVQFQEEPMLRQYKKGDILVFLPGYNEMVKLHLILDQIMAEFKLTNSATYNQNKFKILELHSCLGDINTKELFGRNQDYTKIILATNIAESSITIPNCFVVFDFCLTKEINYNPSSGIEKLELQWASKASITQRAGRTGRNCNGVNIRLIPKQFYLAEIKDYQTPEILRCPIEKVILKIKILDEGESDYQKIHLSKQIQFVLFLILKLIIIFLTKGEDDDVEQNNLIEEIIKEKQMDKTKKKRFNYNSDIDDIDYMKQFDTKPVFDGQETAFLIAGPITKNKSKKQELENSQKLRLFEDPVRVLQRAIEAPDDFSICQSMENLMSVGALKLKKVQYSDTQKEKIKVKVTKLGRFYNDMPCDLKLAKFICFGYFFDCLIECITIASIYSQRKSFFNPFYKISSNLKQIDQFTDLIFRYDQGQESDMILELKIFQEWDRQFFQTYLESIKLRRESQISNKQIRQESEYNDILNMDQQIPKMLSDEQLKLPLSQQLELLKNQAINNPQNQESANAPTLSFQQYLPDRSTEEKPLKGIIDKHSIDEFKRKRATREELQWCEKHFCDPKVLREILSTREDLKQRIPKEAGCIYEIFEFKDLNDDSHLMKIKFCLAGAFNKYTLKSDIFDIKEMQKIRQYLLVEQMDPFSTIIIENTIYGFQSLSINDKEIIIKKIIDGVNHFITSKKLFKDLDDPQNNLESLNHNFVSKVKLKYSSVYIEFKKFSKLPILLKQIMTFKKRYFNFIKLQDKDTNIKEISATIFLDKKIDFDQIFIKQQNNFKYAYEAKLNISNQKLNRLVSLESDSINLVTLGDYNRHKYLVASELMCRGHRVVAQGITVMPPNYPLFLAFAALIFGSQCYVNCDKDGKKYEGVNVDNVEIEIDHYMLDNDINEINDIRRELRACLDEDSFFNGQANLQLDLWNKVKRKLLSRVMMRHVDSEKWEDVYSKEYLNGSFSVNVEEQNKQKVMKILNSIRTTNSSENQKMGEQQQEMDIEKNSNAEVALQNQRKRNVKLLFQNHKRRNNQEKITHASEKGFMNQILQTKKQETNLVTLSEQENINLLQEYFENYNIWKQMKMRELKKFFLLHTIDEPIITCKSCYHQLLFQVPLFKANKLQAQLEKFMKLNFNGFTDNLYLKDIKIEQLLQEAEFNHEQNKYKKEKDLEQNADFIKELKYNFNQLNSQNSDQIYGFKYYACQNGHLIGFTQDDNQLYNQMHIPDCNQLLILYPDLEYKVFSGYEDFQEVKLSDDQQTEIQEHKALMLLELNQISCVICDCVMNDSEKQDEQIKFQDQNVTDWRSKLEKHMKTEAHKLNEEIFLKSTRSPNYFFTN